MRNLHIPTTSAPPNVQDSPSDKLCMELGSLSFARFLWQEVVVVVVVVVVAKFRDGLFFPVRESKNKTKVPRRWCLTLPETNIFAPANWWLEDECPFGTRPIFRCELLLWGRASLPTSWWLKDSVKYYVLCSSNLMIFARISGWTGKISKDVTIDTRDDTVYVANQIFVTLRYRNNCFGMILDMTVISCKKWIYQPTKAGLKKAIMSP